MLTRQRILALASETTLGTAVSLAAANANLKVEDRNLKITRTTATRQKQGSGGNDVGVAEEAFTDLSLTSRLHGGTAVANLGAVLWPACGFVLATRTYSRTWDTSLWKGASAGHFLAGVKMLGRGMLGTARIVMVPGKMWTVEAELQGAYVENPSDATLLTGMTYESTIPPIWVPGSGNALTIDGVTVNAKASQVTVDLGNTVGRREDPNSPGGFISGWIADGAARITLDPEMLLRSGYDWHTAQSTNDTFTFSSVLDGGVNNTITISATVQVIESPDWGDRNGKPIENVVLGEVNDSLTIAYS